MIVIQTGSFESDLIPFFGSDYKFRGELAADVDIETKELYELRIKCLIIETVDGEVVYANTISYDDAMSRLDWFIHDIAATAVMRFLYDDIVENARKNYEMRRL